jgi:hypothetical protein
MVHGGEERADEGQIEESTDEAEGEPEVDDRDHRGYAEPEASDRAIEDRGWVRGGER